MRPTESHRGEGSYRRPVFGGGYLVNTKQRLFPRRHKQRDNDEKSSSLWCERGTVLHIWVKVRRRPSRVRRAGYRNTVFEEHSRSHRVPEQDDEVADVVSSSIFVPPHARFWDVISADIPHPCKANFKGDPHLPCHVFGERVNGSNQGNESWLIAHLVKPGVINPARSALGAIFERVSWLVIERLRNSSNTSIKLTAFVVLLCFNQIKFPNMIG